METKKMTYMQALRLAMDEEMARDEKVILSRQDVGILGRCLRCYRRSVSQIWSGSYYRFAVGRKM